MQQLQLTPEQRQLVAAMAAVTESMRPGVEHAAAGAVATAEAVAAAAAAATPADGRGFAAKPPGTAGGSGASQAHSKSARVVGMLEEAYRCNPYPLRNRAMRDRLVSQTGLSSRQLQDWFYRRRSKDCASAAKPECPEQLLLEAEQVEGADVQPPASLDEARQYVGRTVIKYFEPVPALNYPGGHAAGTVASAQVHMSQPGGQTQLQHSDPTQFYFLVKYGDSYEEHIPWEQLAHILMPIQPDHLDTALYAHDGYQSADAAVSSDGSLQLAATPSAPAAAAAAAAVAAAAAGAAAAAAAAGGGSVWGAALGEAGKKPLPKRHRPFRYIQLPVKKARPLFGDGPFPITLTARMIVDGKAMQDILGASLIRCKHPRTQHGWQYQLYGVQDFRRTFQERQLKVSSVARGEAGQLKVYFVSRASEDGAGTAERDSSESGFGPGPSSSDASGSTGLGRNTPQQQQQQLQQQQQQQSGGLATGQQQAQGLQLQVPGSFLQDAFPGAQYPLAVQVLVEVNGKLHAPATCSTIHYDAQAGVHRLDDDGSLHQLQSMHGLAVEGWKKVEVQGQAQHALVPAALVVSLSSVPVGEQVQGLAQGHAQGQRRGQGLGSGQGQGQGLVQGQGQRQGQAQDQVQGTATSSHLRKHPLQDAGASAKLGAAQATGAGAATGVGAGAGASRTTGPAAAATLRAGEEAAQGPGPGAVQLPAGVAGAGAAVAQDLGAMQGTPAVQEVTGIVGAGAGVVALAAHGHSQQLQQQQLQQRHSVVQHSQGGPAATATAGPASVTAAAVTPAAGEAATEAAAVVAAGEAGLEAETCDDLNSLLLLPDLLSVWDPAAIACATTNIHPAAGFPVHADVVMGAGLWQGEEQGEALVPAAAAGEECLAAAAAAGAALDGAGAWGCPPQVGPGLQSGAGTHPALAHATSLQHLSHLTQGGQEAPLAQGRESPLSLYAVDVVHSQAHVAQGDGGRLGERGWPGEPLHKRQATGSTGVAAPGTRGVASVGLGPALAAGLGLQGLADFAPRH